MAAGADRGIVSGAGGPPGNAPSDEPNLPESARTGHIKPMISGTWGNADPPAEPADDADEQLRPAWEDSEDETDGDLGRRPAPIQAKVRLPGGWPGNDATPAWLGPLCDAADALARLDARAAVAPDAVRQGLIARMAYADVDLPWRFQSIPLAFH